MSMVNDIRTWILNCPDIDSSSLVNLNKISMEVGNYTIDPINVNPIVIENILGEKKYQYDFYIAATFDCSTRANEENAQSKMEDIMDWVDTQETYPTAGGTKIQRQSHVETLSKTESGDKGVYQVAFRYFYE